ncbi:MAG: carotenoid oxygenase family protein [Pararhodobacter sp.]|nr:carotenoid oxygenase family protein [Pararhodobacter sp.]
MQELVRTVRFTVSPDPENPFLKGPFQPNFREYTADTGSLKVEGEIPRDLHGIYIRNTHNQVHEAIGVYHPFDGDAMLHAVHFEDGKATYRNRFVETTGFLAEQAAGRSLWPGILAPQGFTRRGWGAMGAMKDNAGTDVHVHAGKVIAAMSQGSEPWRLDPVTLENLGPDAVWAEKVMPIGVTAHFKVDIFTGEMMFFNFSEQFPYMSYGVVGPENQLLHYVPIELPAPRWPHDLGVTQNYSILHDLPFYFDTGALAHGQRKLTFHRDQPARFGVIPRHGTNDQIRWFEGTPCYILHLSNCYEEGDEIIMDGCISVDPSMPPVGGNEDVYERILNHLDKHRTRTRLHRWRFNLRTGQTKEEFLDDEVTEFPFFANAVCGYAYRYSYGTLFKPGDWLFTGIKKYDLLNDTQTRYEYGPGRYGSEPHVALRPGATAEDDGYIITLVTDMIADRSECLILDAADIEAGPVARITLPERISVGTHACWVEGHRINGEAPATSMAPVPLSA